ncbi:hypothetical protein EAO68_05180 [Streptomyces sp. wa22]|nr:hypothetical protein EAO68_05180 [Streptomyces sp. wa22]
MRRAILRGGTAPNRWLVENELAERLGGLGPACVRAAVTEPEPEPGIGSQDAPRKPLRGLIH